MPVLIQLIISALAGGLLSLIGGVALLATNKKTTVTKYATTFAAGALLAAAFMDVLPEAIHNGESELTLIFALLGFIVFFILEIFLSRFHKHNSHSDTEVTKSVAPMMIIGDTLHNIIDGLAIATGFLASPEAGIIVTLAVAVHEIPQEIGDFGLLLNAGIKRSKVLIINILSSLATVVSAVILYIIGDSFDINLAPMLGLVAGFFIYIAASDIIPTIHSDKSRSSKIKKTICLIIGVVVVGLATSGIHSFVHI